MSQIKPSLLLISVVMMVVCSGCADKNTKSTEHGSDPNWIANHWVTAKKVSPVGSAGIDWAKSPCTQCHGTDLLGGISKISCFSPANGAQICHAEGPSVGHDTGWSQPNRHGFNGAMVTPALSAGFAYCAKCHGSAFNNGDAPSCYSCHTTSPHPPKPWHGTTTSGTNHVYTDPANAAQCAKCHTGGTNSWLAPVSPAAAGTAPGCFNSTLCHSSGHVAGWLDPTSPKFHKFTARISSSCYGCHGADLNGGSAPSCSNTNGTSGLKCHSNGKAEGAKAVNCTSCHGNPPDGTVLPNVKGGHDRHTTLPSLTCTACHNGAGSGTSLHANGTVNVIILTSLKAKKASSNPVKNSDNTCDNVSCHGGNKTPVWGTTNGLACTSCHEQGTGFQVPEYNSYYSGQFAGVSQHLRHLARINPATGLTVYCTDCHDINKLTKQQHFGGAASRQFVFPGNTIGGGTTSIGSYNADNSTGSTTCSAVSCHKNVPANNIQWTVLQ